MRKRDIKTEETFFIITGHENNPANLYIKEVSITKGILRLDADGKYRKIDGFSDCCKYFIGYDINGNYYPINPITTFKDKDKAKTMLRLWLKNAYYREINHI